MCDLIDLNSPDVKGVLDAAKLASPLIPAPTAGGDAEDGGGGEANPLAVGGKCEHADSNPFDKVLHETAEYISKKGDPFEVMLQRALKFNSRRNAELRRQPVPEFTDDFTPKRKRRYLKMMNKTLDALDESLLAGKLDLSYRKPTTQVKEGSVSRDAKNTNVVGDNNVMETPPVAEKDHKILVTGPDSLELSILNQSAMNDTLLEPAFKAKAHDEVSSPLLENDTLLKRVLLPLGHANVNSTDSRRALSQGDSRSPTRLPCLSRRVRSATDERKGALHSENSTVSSLDRGFIDSKQSEQSVFSSLSNVSSVTKLNSTSVSLLALSSDTMNDAFLNSGSLAANRKKMSTSEDPPGVKQYDLAELTERLNKLKCAINGTNSGATNEIDSTNGDNNRQIANDKLIDVDVFVLEQNSSKERNKSSISTNSSDSVFTDTSKQDKSILNEARALARTFEELALKTNSGSSIDDDLISNNTQWMSELLPAFEEESVVENLIELPVSPERDPNNVKEDDGKCTPTSTDNTKENSLKEIASQFADCVPTIRQTNVTSLLSDLKKLIKAENNAEVIELLDNLEIALGTNCKNNTELLMTCLNMSNELQSPRKFNTVQNSEKTSTDKGKDESEKISSEGEVCNSKKTLPDVTNKLENTPEGATTATADDACDDDVSARASCCKNNSESPDNDAPNAASNTKEQNGQSDEKLAMELLMNLGKLLHGQAEDAATMRLVRNIGKTLNIASSTCKFENERRTDCDRKRNVQKTAAVKTVAPDRVADLASATRRRSFNYKSPKAFEKTGRQSVSAIDSPTRNTPNAQRRYKSTSEVENRKKRFSSDRELVNLTNKKAAIPEARKKEANIREHDVRKEKPIAIDDVKNKLKKRSNVINKRGPMKAVHPVNNIQKGASLGKQPASSCSIITPPKSEKKITASGNKIISSTPNSDSSHCIAKPARSKPIASSTPDPQNGKVSSAQLTSANNNNKSRNFSCDISPVTTYANANDNDERKDSPRRPSKLPTPKCMTPKRRETDTFRVSRHLTPPRHNTSFNVNHQQPPTESPQRLNRSLVGYRRYSPVCQRKNDEKEQQNPLKENNRVIAKVKPLKLISKLKRHSHADFIEKENDCA